MCCTTAICCLTGALVAGNWQGGPVDDPAAAMVADQPVFCSQVEWLFHSKLGGHEPSPETAARLRAEILDQLVNQQLILARLSQSGLDMTPQEVDLEIARITERVQATGETFSDWLAANGQSLASLRFNVRWQSVWGRYLETTLTDEVLERYFQRHLRQFDGTQMQVAHLLLPLASAAGPGEQEQVMEQARTIRQQMVDGQLAWEEATRRYSSAPTADSGGQLGWIEYSRPMSPEFSETAFGLQADEISQPVQTSAGIHLIRCLAIRPGSNNWYDVRQPLKSAAVRELFRLLADRQRQQSEIRYTGAAPYRDPQTSRLVLPAQDASGDPR